jgi:hypothetical protein
MVPLPIGLGLTAIHLRYIVHMRQMKVNSAMVPLLIGLGLTAIHLRYQVRMRQMKVNSAMVPLLIGLGLTAINLRYCILRMHQIKVNTAMVPLLSQGPAAHRPGSDCYSPQVMPSLGIIVCIFCSFGLNAGAGISRARDTEHVHAIYRTIYELIFFQLWPECGRCNQSGARHGSACVDRHGWLAGDILSKCVM